MKQRMRPQDRVCGCLLTKICRPTIMSRLVRHCAWPLASSRGSSRTGLPLKPQLAEHLGIPETRVAKYLSDHCVVRWLQMDDEAHYFAHFLIAVLRPTLNE